MTRSMIKQMKALLHLKMLSWTTLRNMKKVFKHMIESPFVSKLFFSSLQIYFMSFFSIQCMSDCYTRSVEMAICMQTKYFIKTKYFIFSVRVRQTPECFLCVIDFRCSGRHHQLILCDSLFFCSMESVIDKQTH